MESYNGANTIKLPILLNPNGGKVGVGTLNPLDRFQINEGSSKVAIGDASGPSMGYGTGYVGLNAARVGNNWNLVTDGANNGGAVIYSSIFGNLYFSTIGTTGASDRVLSDSEVKSKIQLHISTDGTTYAKSIKVQTTNWPDYVFKKDYRLNTLEEVSIISIKINICRKYQPHKRLAMRD